MMSFRRLSMAVRQNCDAGFSTTIGNGVRIASESVHGETACISVHVGSGSRHENEGNSGASHMLAHLALQGSQKPIQALGGRITAEVHQEKTVFTAQVMQKDVPKAMELLGKMVQQPSVNQADLERERSALLRNHDAATRDYACRIMDHVHESAFSGTDLARANYGIADNLANLSSKDLNDFAATHFTSEATVVAVVGAVKQDAVAELANKHFSHVSNTAAPHMSPAIFVGCDKRIRFDSMKQAHVTLAFEGVARTSKSYFPAMLMKTIIGKWCRQGAAGKNASSKLARELSEEGFVHEYAAFNASYKDTGLFGIQLVAADNTLDNAMWYVLDNLVRLCHNVTEGELERAKIQLKADILAGTASNAGLAADIADQILATGRLQNTEELMQSIQSVQLKDVKATANDIINDEDHVLAAVGPIYELPDYNWIRRRSYWHRY